MVYYAASILKGFCTFFLTEFDEEYVLSFPDLHAKGFVMGPLTMEVVGRVQIECKKTKLLSEVVFKSKPVFGGDYNSCSGRVVRYEGASAAEPGKTTELYTFDGKWDDVITIVDVNTKEKSTLWAPEGEERPALMKPVIADRDPFESDVLWEGTTKALLADDQVAATEHKTLLENNQRAVYKKLHEEKREWEPKWFDYDAALDTWRYKWVNNEKWNPATEGEEVEYKGRVSSVPPSAAASAAVGGAAAAAGNSTRSPSGKAKKAVGGAKKAAAVTAAESPAASSKSLASASAAKLSSSGRAAAEKSADTSARTAAAASAAAPAATTVAASSTASSTPSAATTLSDKFIRGALRGRDGVRCVCRACFLTFSLRTFFFI